MFGSAKDEIDRCFISEVEKLGELLAEKDYTIYFGAGSTGLMGAIARGAKKKDGKLIGVVPNFMDNFEPIFEHCDTIITTKTMEARKSIIKNAVNSFIVCPGGIGTLDEFFEILTDKYLKLHNKPIVLLNTNGYYDHIVKLITEYVNQRFIGERVMGLFSVANTAEEAFEMLKDNWRWFNEG